MTAPSSKTKLASNMHPPTSPELASSAPREPGREPSPLQVSYENAPNSDEDDDDDVRLTRPRSPTGAEASHPRDRDGPPAGPTPSSQPKADDTAVPAAVAGVLPVPFSLSLTLRNNGSVARDHLASERTFLAYVRTSLAFASAGVGPSLPLPPLPLTLSKVINIHV